MRQVSATAAIPAPADELFEFLADPANLPSWQTGIVTAQRTSSGPLGPGATARVERDLMGQRLAVDLKMTAYEPGRRLVLESEVSGIGVEATLELEPAAEGARSTSLRFGMSIRARNPFMAPIEGMVAGAAERDLADSLGRLRRHFEA
jgi:uncharacterized protein YndB with AHSA1/START domain